MRETDSVILMLRKQLGIRLSAVFVGYFVLLILHLAVSQYLENKHSVLNSDWELLSTKQRSAAAASLDLVKIYPKSQAQQQEVQRLFADEALLSSRQLANLDRLDHYDKLQGWNTRAFGAVLVGFFLSVLWVVLQYRKGNARLRRGLCIHCGYDLRHNPDRCPECGTPR